MLDTITSEEEEGIEYDEEDEYNGDEHNGDEHNGDEHNEDHNEEYNDEQQNVTETQIEQEGADVIDSNDEDYVSIPELDNEPIINGEKSNNSYNYRDNSDNSDDLKYENENEEDIEDNSRNSNSDNDDYIDNSLNDDVFSYDYSTTALYDSLKYIPTVPTPSLTATPTAIATATQSVEWQPIKSFSSSSLLLSSLYSRSSTTTTITTATTTNNITTSSEKRSSLTIQKMRDFDVNVPIGHDEDDEGGSNDGNDHGMREDHESRRT